MFQFVWGVKRTQTLKLNRFIVLWKQNYHLLYRLVNKVYYIFQSFLLFDDKKRRGPLTQWHTRVDDEGGGVGGCKNLHYSLPAWYRVHTLCVIFFCVGDNSRILNGAHDPPPPPQSWLLNCQIWIVGIWPHLYHIEDNLILL